jgi:hypothetical protein
MFPKLIRDKLQLDNAQSIEIVTPAEDMKLAGNLELLAILIPHPLLLAFDVDEWHQGDLTSAFDR